MIPHGETVLTSQGDEHEYDYIAPLTNTSEPKAMNGEFNLTTCPAYEIAKSL